MYIPTADAVGCRHHRVRRGLSGVSTLIPPPNMPPFSPSPIGWQGDTWRGSEISFERRRIVSVRRALLEGRPWGKTQTFSRSVFIKLHVTAQYGPVILVIISMLLALVLFILFILFILLIPRENQLHLLRKPLIRRDKGDILSLRFLCKP